MISEAQTFHLALVLFIQNMKFFKLRLNFKLRLPIHICQSQTLFLQTSS